MWGREVREEVATTPIHRRAEFIHGVPGVQISLVNKHFLKKY
jgi:hypothetical protein